MKNKRLCVHLHFAPPQARTPWAGEEEEDPASWPFRDPWELYFHRWVEPHLRGAQTDEDGLLLEPASSLDAAGFSFSPGLLAWIESHRPSAYRLILETDARSLTSSGHGAAVAGLPDCPPGGRVAALAASLEVFYISFGRKADGAWLGEAAAPSLLDAAAASDLRFVLAAGRLGSEEDGGHLPLLWEDGSRGLAVFFPDPGLSGAVEKLALRLASRLHAGNTAELVLLAERAERFSENGRQGSRILIAAFSEIARQETFKPASPAVFLDLFPPPRKLERPPAPAPSASGERPRCEDRGPLAAATRAARAAFRDHLRYTLGFFRSPARDTGPGLVPLARLRRKSRLGERNLTLCRVVVHPEEEAFFGAVLHRGRVDMECFLLPGTGEERCAEETRGLSAAFESQDGDALEAALTALGGLRFGLDSLPASDRRRAVLDLLPPAGATGAALRAWGDALAAFESDPGKAPGLFLALRSALSAGITPRSLPEVPWLRERARALAEGFSRSGGEGALQPLLVLLELLGSGLGSDLGEFEAAALEGLRAGGTAAPSASGERPRCEDRGPLAAGAETERLAAILGISPAASMRYPVTKSGGNG